ncbi:predicted protein [Uncinocarpus reesii 1704]|uniref:Uncharacterized protein n=1 Tax=Uncinocarpus reesii (strain UAMH 1704) TaxID=336963 RepID=C4JFS8_UNCRE|nr:uncharacterized protein UREG_02412 [Uncinocarpus reesii 1704]EEP77563.1 predicted protein [Uncinocarpus reesii 1704]
MAQSSLEAILATRHRCPAGPENKLTCSTTFVPTPSIFNTFVIEEGTSINAKANEANKFMDRTSVVQVLLTSYQKGAGIMLPFLGAEVGYTESSKSTTHDIFKKPGDGGCYSGYQQESLLDSNLLIYDYQKYPYHNCKKMLFSCEIHWSLMPGFGKQKWSSVNKFGIRRARNQQQ